MLRNLEMLQQYCTKCKDNQCQVKKGLTIPSKQNFTAKQIRECNLIANVLDLPTKR